MHILIAEDEQLSARRLQKMVADILGEETTFIVVETVVEAMEAIIGTDSLDLLLLDIQLADGSSLELFRQTEVAVPVIFTTAYDEHAVSAFRLNAIDYLLKPIKREELAAAIDRWSGQRKTQTIDFQKLARELRGKSHTQRFLIRSGQQMHLVNASEIAYLTTESRTTILHNLSGRRFVLDQSLDALERELNPADFFRVNRQFIIHRQAIESLHTYSKGRVKISFSDGQDTIVSVERSPDFKTWLVEGGV